MGREGERERDVIARFIGRRKKKGRNIGDEIT